MKREIVYSYDPTDLCELTLTEREQIRSHIEIAKGASDIKSIKDEAYKSFNLICNHPDIFSSIKDYDHFKFAEKEVRKGIHILRAYFAELVGLRRRMDNGITTQYGSQIEEFGVVQINDLIDLENKECIKREMELFDISVSKNDHNIISFQERQKYPNLYQFLDQELLQKIIFDCVAYEIENEQVHLLHRRNTFVQKIHNKPDDNDIQKVLHSDTFFPCLKWWYFPDKVDLEDGPFAYVPKSHILSYDRLKFIHEQSIAIARNEIDSLRTCSHAEGSLRIFESELHRLNLKEVKLVVPGNTLVLANLVGFHRRSHVSNQAFRLAIHGSIRVSNPFQ